MRQSFLRLIAVLSLVLSPAFLPVAAVAQSQSGVTREYEKERAYEDRQKSEELQRDFDRRRSYLSSSSYYSRRGKDYYSSKLTPGQKRLLAPTDEDLLAHAEFLKQQHTGLARLLPKGKYELEMTVAVDRDPDTVLPIRGGGAYYSFGERTHHYGPWSEISLQSGFLMTGFTYESLGLFTELGDLPLESVTLTTPGVEFLARYAPPRKYMEAAEHRNLNFEGFQVGEFRYSSLIPFKTGSTYALRSIAYKKEGRVTTAMIYVPHPEEYRGADSLIVFRILRQDADGSLVVLWKRLKKFDAYKLKDRPRPRRVKAEDVRRMVDKSLAPGADVSEVKAFLNSERIEHTQYREGEATLDVKSNDTERDRIYAMIFDAEVIMGAVYHIRIKFFFDDRGKLAEYEVEKVSDRD